MFTKDNQCQPSNLKLSFKRVQYFLSSKELYIIDIKLMIEVFIYQVLMASELKFWNHYSSVFCIEKKKLSLNYY